MDPGITPLTLGGEKLHAEPKPGQPLPMGRELPFDLDWRFYRGRGEGLESPDFDDSDWRLLALPHDWSIEDAPAQDYPDSRGPFVASAEGGRDTGFTLGGEGWYRKRFVLPELPEQGQVEIQFEGVAVISDVWVNGHHVGRHVHGYTPFNYPISRYIRRGGPNLVAVRVRNPGRNSRWYAGSGIYRSISLNVLPGPARIAHWGVAAWTREIDEFGAKLDISTRLDNAVAGLILTTRLLDLQGKPVAEETRDAAPELKQTLTVTEPRLWSPDKPNLHVLETLLLRGDEVIDRMRQPCGLRIVNFDAEHGMSINGEQVKMRGGCIHHDNGLLGAAACPDAEERKVLLLKARGFNVLRSSHNPTSRALRRACDRHGMLLIEEAFDMWHARKLPDDYAQYFADHWQQDIRRMVLSARNSPSVIMWSIGNEVPERSTPAGVEWCWRLANEVHRLDPTRPVTAGINGSPGRPLVAAEGTARQGEAGKSDYASSIFLDVVGYNYKLADFTSDHALRPDRVFYGSETYPREAYDYLVLAREAPYMIGECVWTAMDYLGEAGIGLSSRLPAADAHPRPHEFPVVVSFCGDLDLIGGQKPQSLARDVIWGLSPLEVTVARPLPEGLVEFVPLWGWPDEQSSWTWPGAEGTKLKVRLYTAADRIEVRLNGEPAGEKQLSTADRMRAEVDVPYAPGTLEVIAYGNGLELGRRQLETAGAPHRIQLTPESLRGKSSQQSLHYLRVDVQDARGRPVPDSSIDIKASIEGPAQLVAFGSANPRAVGSFQSNRSRTYQGKALLILRSTLGTGDVRVRVTGGNMEAGEVTLS